MIYYIIRYVLAAENGRYPTILETKTTECSDDKAEYITMILYSYIIWEWNRSSETQVQYCQYQSQRLRLLELGKPIIRQLHLLDIKQLSYEFDKQFLDLKQQNTELQIVFEKVVSVLKRFKKNNSVAFVSKAFFNSFQSVYINSQHRNEFDKLECLQRWNEIDPIVLNSYIKYFEIKVEDIQKEVIDNFTVFIQNKKYNNILVYNDVFDLRFDQHFDFKQLITIMIQQDKVQPAIKLVSNRYPNLYDFVIQTLFDNEYKQQATDFIIHHNLNIDDYQYILDHLKTKYLKYLMKQYDFQKQEDHIRHRRDVLVLYVRLLLQQDKQREVYTIVNRYCLQKEFEGCQEIEQIMGSDHQIIDNLLVSKDQFTYTEQLFSDQQFIHLSEFGFDEQSVLFIDSESDCNYEQSLKTLRNSKFIGIDSEFNVGFTKFDKRDIATLQLSTDHQIFVFDMQKLNSSKQFVSFLIEIFGSSDNFIVGHGLQCDIELFKTNLNKKEIVFDKLIDIQYIFQQVNQNEKQSSLQHICNSLIGKQMSKYEQISNWSQRPLRKAQLHYAALDALVCVKILHKMVEQYQIDIDYCQSHNINKQKQKQKQKQHNGYKKKKKKEKQLKNEDKVVEQINDDNRDDDKIVEQVDNDISSKEIKKQKNMIRLQNTTNGVYLCTKEQQEEYHQQLKFVIDNMLYKLAKFLRNIGVDTEYLQNSSFKELERISSQQKRVIITMEKSFLKRNLQVPCYLLYKHKADDQLLEIIEFFKINVDSDKFLKRCTKCNNDSIIIIDKDEAQKSFSYSLTDEIEEYFKCDKCQQVYWEGAQFQKSQKKFRELLNCNVKKTE